MPKFAVIMLEVAEGIPDEEALIQAIKRLRPAELRTGLENSPSLDSAAPIIDNSVLVAPSFGIPGELPEILEQLSSDVIEEPILRSDGLTRPVEPTAPVITHGIVRGQGKVRYEVVVETPSLEIT